VWVWQLTAARFEAVLSNAQPLAADGSGTEGSDCDLGLAERILPRASDLWVKASLDYKQRL